MDKELDMRMELQQDAMENEFNSIYSDKDVLEDMVDNITKDDLVQMLIDCDVYSHDFFIEHRKEMCKEHWENR